MKQHIAQICNEVLNAPNSLVKVDINDMKDLFQEEKDIHVFDVSVNAAEGNRMQLMIEQMKKEAKSVNLFTRALVFFFSPKENPILMSELQPFSDWMESIPGELSVNWGMATTPSQALRAIVLLQ